MLIVLEKETAIHSSIHAWKIPWTEEPGGLKSMGRKESDMTEQLVCVCVCVCVLSIICQAYFKNSQKGTLSGA